MKDEKKVPKLRFKGFTDDWEQCKLGDVAKINSGKDYKGLQPGKIPVYGTGGYMLSVNDKLSDIDAIGIGRKGTIDKPYYLNAPFWTVDTLFYVTPRGTVDISFMFPLFKNINWKRYDESTGVPSLSKNTIKKIRVSFPQNNEQVKIGDLFQKITQIITLHEEKKHQLERLKSALLQKMFADESGYPVVRFEGFSDEWEQRKLGEVADVRDGTHDSPRYINEGYPLLTSKNVDNGYINYDDVKYVSENDYVQINKRSKVDINDILMGMIGTIGNLALIREEPDFAIKNVALIKHTSNFDYQFLFQELQTSAISKELLSGMDGGTQKFVSLKKIRNLSVMLPSENEQKQIGAFFKQFDSLIALHQRKLDLLKEQKKGFLQKMFI
ncbi:restriction endonuclease subunit S [Lactobacillus delbrueckii]|uniref:restriction endonuclease subunit S n=1 Tax=Lactobacillus delbrueckii TaxID=1584 RepID=UPI003852CFCC